MGDGNRLARPDPLPMRGRGPGFGAQCAIPSPRWEGANRLTLPADYVERTYAGVLGKIIGVYLGRPFEFWLHERIEAELGQVWYYLHDRFSVPLIVTDDDISGTFTFLRSLADNGNDPKLTSTQIGETWLNYIVEERTILWWGGFGNSAEHTAYLRLKNGVPAPQSGSIALNSKVLAEQIGAQIFIDGWAMVAPGDPARAADLAARAARVSHDSEAVYAAQVLAAMEARAYVEPDINRLLECALSLIPKDSVINRVAHDLREWRTQTPDWREARRRIGERYGYDKYLGNCHVVPNHALILLGLLYGDNDFQRSLMIVNTSGWDTDCNSGNLGCLLGIKNGLAGIEEGPDWRGPVADRLYLSTADGGRAVTDAVTETLHIVNGGRALVGDEPLAPKNGARYHFTLPGSVQGWRVDTSALAGAQLKLDNCAGDGEQRSLTLRYAYLAPGGRARAFVDTFIPPEAIEMSRYGLLASPKLSPGQVVTAHLTADSRNASPVPVRLYLGVYDGQDQLCIVPGPETVMRPGDDWNVEWTVPATDGQPISRIGVELTSDTANEGAMHLDWLTWKGSPTVRLVRPEDGGMMWRRAWVNAVDHEGRGKPEPFRLMQDRGTGMLIYGTREWRDYTVEAVMEPHLVAGAGIAARVQGLRRYYALKITDHGEIQLIKARDGIQTLASTAFSWQPQQIYTLKLMVKGQTICAYVDGRPVFTVEDTERLLVDGAVALVCEEGRVDFNEVTIRGDVTSNEEGTT